MKKLKAFTLIELCVAIIISGIVTAAGFGTYAMFSKQFIEHRKINESVAEKLNAYTLLKKDIDKADRIQKKSDSEILLTSKTTEVDYSWNENYLLRKCVEQTDTFYISVKAAQLSFLSKEQNKDNGIVDEIHLSTLYEKQVEDLYFRKQYSAAVLMENDNQFINN